MQKRRMLPELLKATVICLSEEEITYTFPALMELTTSNQSDGRARPLSIIKDIFKDHQKTWEIELKSTLGSAKQMTSGLWKEQK